MTIYIPIVTIGWVFLGYLGTGLVLYPLLWKWQSRFIAGYKTRSRKDTWRGFANPRRMLVFCLVWPVVLIVTIYTEIKYRKKGYL